MKYKELGEPCRSAIKEGRCTGCNRLELEWFRGDAKCDKYEKKEEYSKGWKIGGINSGRESKECKEEYTNTERLT